MFVTLAILIAALCRQMLRLNTAYPIIVASMGASAVIVFIIPSSPLAQPWPLLGGHMVSALIGVFCNSLIADTVLASSSAAGSSVLAMLLSIAINRWMSGYQYPVPRQSIPIVHWDVVFGLPSVASGFRQSLYAPEGMPERRFWNWPKYLANPVWSWADSRH